jgi:hypothetical protein
VIVGPVTASAGIGKDADIKRTLANQNELKHAIQNTPKRLAFIDNAPEVFMKSKFTVFSTNA